MHERQHTAATAIKNTPTCSYYYNTLETDMANIHGAHANSHFYPPKIDIEQLWESRKNDHEEHTTFMHEPENKNKRTESKVTEEIAMGTIHYKKE